MPYRLLRLSRTEPARTILLVLGFVSAVMQLSVLLPWVTPTHVLTVVPNLVIVASIGFWSMVSAIKNNPQHMSMSSFWLFVMWLWSGLTRLAFSPHPEMLLWCPFLATALALAVVYVYLSGVRRDGKGVDDE